MLAEKLMRRQRTNLTICSDLLSVYCHLAVAKKNTKLNFM